MMRTRVGIVVGAALSLTLGFVDAAPAATATITVNSTGDDNPAGADDGDCTLREAIDAANSDAAEDGCTAGTGADIIMVPAGTYTLTVPGAGEEAGETGDLDLLTEMNIVGAGPATTTVDANGNERPFHTPGTATPPPIEISGLTIRGGNVPTDGGGGIFNQGALLRVVNVVLTGGISEYGGGIANDNPAKLTMLDSLVAGNTASTTDVGGGVDLDGVVSSFTNVTVSGNSAQDGGGLWVDGGTATLNNVTVTGNTATNGGVAGGIEASGTTILRNTILAGNTTTGTGPDCIGTITSEGHNIIGKDTDCTITATTGDKVGTGAAPVDAKLGPLADNGGPTMTHALLGGSPAIDGGDPATPGSGGTSCAATDQRGLPRNCDIGAYELVLCQGVPVNRLGAPPGGALTGTDNADGFLGGPGNDTATGLGGDDAFCLEGGDDTATGGSGNDQILGAAGNDTGDGGDGDDIISGSDGNDTGSGGAGNDTFLGGPGNDTGKGAAGRDLLKGEDGIDKLNGGSGKDKLLGGRGKDKINCGSGRNETGKGGAGKDKSLKCEKGKA